MVHLLIIHILYLIGIDLMNSLYIKYKINNSWQKYWKKNSLEYPLNSGYAGEFNTSETIQAYTSMAEKDPIRVAAGQKAAETIKGQDPQHFEKIGAMGGQATAQSTDAHERGVKAAQTTEERYGPGAHAKMGAGDTVKPQTPEKPKWNTFTSRSN